MLEKGECLCKKPSQDILSLAPTPSGAGERLSLAWKDALATPDSLFHWCTGNSRSWLCGSFKTATPWLFSSSRICLRLRHDGPMAASGLRSRGPIHPNELHIPEKLELDTHRRLPCSPDPQKEQRCPSTPKGCLGSLPGPSNPVYCVIVFCSVSPHGIEHGNDLSLCIEPGMNIVARPSQRLAIGPFE